MTRIAVVGAGYVGLTTAACLTHLGHSVKCADVSIERVEMLRRGELPFLEEGLYELVRAGLNSERLSFTSDNVAAVSDAELVFLCVPTPEGEGGQADTTHIEAAVTSIARALCADSVVVNKSTVPVGSTRVIERFLNRIDVCVVSNPEFLREGSAIQDFLHPDRIVIGADNPDAIAKVAQLYEKLEAPIVVTDPASAETIKYASNAFLATKISFANAIAALCESVGANVIDVLRAVGQDPRIGPQYLNPGPGWGGSCLPKDTQALVNIAGNAGYDFSLLRGVIAVNDEQIRRVIAKVIRLAEGSVSGKIVGLLGLAFKAGTDDLRGSPALRIAGILAGLGAKIHAFDPAVTVGMLRSDQNFIELQSEVYAASAGASVLVIATEWDEFSRLDLAKLMSRGTAIRLDTVL